MSSKVSEVEGSLSVSRDCTVGGALTVRGSSLFSRGVTIKGWLDAPNIKHAYKGLYPSEDALLSSCPSPSAGWYALVAPFDAVAAEDAGDDARVLLEDVATVYAVENGAWVATGLSSAQLNGYLQEMEDNYDTFAAGVADAIADISDKVSSLDAATTASVETISAELTTVRASAVAAEATAVASEEKAAAVATELGNYVKEGTVATSSSLGLVSVPSSNGLSVADGVLTLATATSTTAGVLSATDKVTYDATAAAVAALSDATLESAGLMSSTDKAVLGTLRGAIPYFSGVLNGVVGILNRSTADAIAVWYIANVGFAAQDSAGLYYSLWESNGVFLSSDYYTCDGSRAYHSDGMLWRYDSVGGSLVLLCDLSCYVQRDEMATADSDGLLSKEDKVSLDGVSSLIASGRLSNGTARFDDYCCTKKLNGTLDEATVCHDWDGIIWLSDRKVFAAYKGVAVLSGCDCAEVSFVFYLHWDTERIYMEEPGVSCGLWKDKVYLYSGHLWQWKRCDSQLELSGAAGDYEVLTDDEIDEILDGFTFVAPVEGALSSVSVAAEYPLVAGDTVYDGAGGASVPLSIVEASSADIDNIFNGE